jgi:diguanylate cyclase (GGDEF)-like protein
MASRRDSAPAVDPQTGCATLESLDRRVREELERARRYGSELAFALIDVDALRMLNARLGPEAGDRFLSELGRVLRQEIRAPDFVARYDSGVFALLMPATNAEGARQVLGRIAGGLGDHRWTDLPPSEHPRLAAGLVTCPHPGVGGPDDLLALAEAALAAGKAGTGDRVGLAAA